MKFKKIISFNIYETVVKQIMNLIKNNELKPGEKILPERELAEKLGISRGSLREAFRVLESRGIIKSKPGGGRYVRDIKNNVYNNANNIILSLEKSSVLELLEAREIIEVKIVELAAQRATCKDLELIEKFLTKINEEERSEFCKDIEFHLAIAKASHNYVFVNIMEWNLELLRETRNRAWQTPERIKEQPKEHQAIFEAIKKHDSKKAAKVVLKHLTNVKKAIMKI